MTTTTAIIIALAVILGIASIAGIKKLIDLYRTENIVWENQLALHFKDGCIAGPLAPGKHVFFGKGNSFLSYDRRQQEIVVQSQELITADKATLKVSAVILFNIEDAAKMFTCAGSPNQVLYTSVQLALREIVGGQSIDQFLESKSSFGKALAGHAAAAGNPVGLKVERVEIRDVILGSDLKAVYTGVLRARNQALAEIERARGEAAALRTLANASRVFEKNPTLLQLRYMQSLEQMAGASGASTFILGRPEDLPNQKAAHP